MKSIKVINFILFIDNFFVKYMIDVVYIKMINIEIYEIRREYVKVSRKL